MITVNGEKTEYTKGQTLKQLLASRGYPVERVAVEMDGEIVPKSAYLNQIIKDGCRLEIVCFVGGG